jgi:rhodanese-related sulfurtransferase
MTAEGVASPEELRTFVEEAGDKLLVVDVRNGHDDYDQKSLTVAPLPGPNYRPHAINLSWDRGTNSMPLPDASIPKDTPIITHCGGGKRGQAAKDFLTEHGFTNVLNGAGPKETACWVEYGNK